jgi:hypothetical protein
MQCHDLRKLFIDRECDKVKRSIEGRKKGLKLSLSIEVLKMKNVCKRVLIKAANYDKRQQ